MECLLCQQKIRKEKSLKQLFELKEQYDICYDCHLKFETIGDKHCKWCYKIGIEGLCRDCQKWQESGYTVDHKALYTYNRAMKKFFSSYKFSGDYMLRYCFQRDIQSALKIYKDFVVIPVPISRKNFSQRKFNQVEGLLEAAHINFQSLLRADENKKIEDQSRKTKVQRLETKQFFSITKDQKLPPKVVIVDDVYTTGKTLMLAKEILYENGVEKVKTFSLAR